MTGEFEEGGARKVFIRRTLLVFWAAAALLALGVSPYWRIGPDSALYAGIAKSVATGHGYTWSGETQWSIPPVTPLYLSLAYKVGHLVHPRLTMLSTFFYFNAFVAAAGMAGLVAAFFLAIELAGPKRALLVAAFLVSSRWYFKYSIQPLTDVPYSALSWGAMLYLVRADRRGGVGNRVAAGTFVALAVMTRLVGTALVAAAGVYFLAKALRARAERRQAVMNVVALAPAAAAVLVQVFLAYVHRGGAVFNYFDDLATGRSWGEIFGRTGHDFATLPAYLFEGVVGLESVWGLGLIFTAFVVWGGFGSLRRGGALAGVYFVCYLLFVASGEEVLPRYVTPLLPIVYLFLIEAVRAVIGWGRQRGAGWRAAAVLSALLVAANLVYVGREIARNFSRDFYASYHENRIGGWRAYFDLAQALEREALRGKVMAYSARIVGVLSGIDTLKTPYHPETRHRPAADEIARYVKENDIGAIVVDEEFAESAKILEDFISKGPLAWRRVWSSGNVSLYRAVGEESGGDR